MKRTLVAIAAILLTAAATYAQSGAVNFNNRVVGVVDSPVVTASGTGAGTVSGMQVQLFQVGAGGSLTAIGSAISFRGTTDPLAKYFDGGATDIPGTTPGGTATLRVRAWTGASFAAAGNTHGESADFTAALGGGTLPPENLANLKGFTVVAVPEPATLALGVLGIAGVLMARRRK
jgi:hypothetical protein